MNVNVDRVVPFPGLIIATLTAQSRANSITMAIL